MKILVLGGAGYIGSHTVRELLKNGYEVVIADNLQTGHKESIPDGVKFYEGDIRDKNFLDKLFETEKIAAVIHFAANALVGESMVDPLKYYDNNVYGTMVVLKSMVEHKIGKIVFSSSSAIYGEPKNLPILETDFPEPTNTYGESKLAMEKMIKWVSKIHGIKYVALRYFNACGASPDGKIGEHHAIETHIMPLVIQTALGQRDFVTILGDDYPTKDGTCVRDYVHVSDLARGHVLALKYLDNGGESDVFNLGNGSGYSVKEIIDAVKRVSGRDFQVKITKRRPGDPARLVASSEKAEKVLGWTPEFKNLDEIIKTAWNWHKNHPHGYRLLDNLF